MKPVRTVVAAAAATALAAAALSPAPALAQDPAPAPAGVSTSSGDLTVLGLDLGGLLSLDLLSDLGVANIDDSVGVPSAGALLSALAIESPALGVSQELPILSVQSTGAPDDKSQAVTPLANPVLSGSLLPSTLRALVDGDGARSQLSGGLVDLDVLGGVLTLAGTELGLGSSAAGGQADGLRGLSIDALSVLDLEALLAGLGIPLTDLPLDTVLGLVDALGLLPLLNDVLAQLGLPGLDLGEDLSVEGILVVLDTVADAVGSPVDLISGAAGPVCDVVDQLVDPLDPVLDPLDPVLDPVVDTIDDIVGGLGLGQTAAIECADLVGTVTNILDQLPDLSSLLDTLGAALDAPLDLLGDLSLLELQGLDVAVVTTATDDLATSAADVTAALGGLTVGNILDLPAMDLLGAVDQVNATLGQVESVIGAILSQVDPRLGDLVRIQTLQELTSVAANDAGGVTSSAEFTGLRIDVLPDVQELLAIIGDLSAVTSIGDQLTALGLPLPAVPEVLDFNGLLAGVPTTGLFDSAGVFALTEGMTVEVASVSQTASFTPVAATPATPAAPQTPQAPTQVPALPTTGGNDTLLLVLGAGAVAAALTGRRVLRARGA